MIPMTTLLPKPPLERALQQAAPSRTPAAKLPVRAKLTKRSVEALPIPSEDTVVWDVDLSGFGLRLLPSGARTYVLQRRTRAGRSVRLKIARVGELSCEQARDQAKRLIAEIVTGGDPAADRRKARQTERQRREAPTVADLAEAWQQDRRPHWRPATEIEIGRQVGRYVLPAIGRRKAAEVKPAHVRELGAEVGKAVMANRVVSTVRSMYSWAIHRDDWPSITVNPAAGVAMNHEARRERFPQNGELQRLVTVLHERRDLASKFYLFLLLTGARRGEVENMRWSDVDLAAGVWTKPAASTKQKRSHRLPLSPEAVELLRAVQVEQPFAPFARLDDWQLRKAWGEILTEARVTDLRVHDLRHWHASLLASMGLSLPIIGALLGHSSPSTTQRYAHLLDAALRQAADRVGEVVRLPSKREG
jgi:integrase